MATTASISRLVVQYRRCEGLSALLQYATTSSRSSWIWLKPPPSPKLLASVSRTYCPVSVGKAKIGASISEARKPGKQLNNWCPTQTAHLSPSNAPTASRHLQTSDKNAGSIPQIPETVAHSSDSLEPATTLHPLSSSGHTLDPVVLRYGPERGQTLEINGICLTSVVNHANAISRILTSNWTAQHQTSHRRK